MNQTTVSQLSRMMRRGKDPTKKVVMTRACYKYHCKRMQMNSLNYNSLEICEFIQSLFSPAAWSREATGRQR